MTGTSMGVNQRILENIVNALVEALPCDAVILQPLADMMSVEIPASGLGYIGTAALDRIREKLEAASLLQDGSSVSL